MTAVILGFSAMTQLTAVMAIALNRKQKMITTEPNQAVEPTIMAGTPRAPSSTSRASHDRGSL